MKQLITVRSLLLFLCLFVQVVATEPRRPAAETETKPGKAPVIVIPGLTGSELVNRYTLEKVWFNTSRSKVDDLRLPTAPNFLENRDSLIPGDIIRSLKFVRFLPEVEIYARLIDGLQKRGGYEEGNWDKPGKDGDRDKFYVFPYDWRRDNVENARLLVRQVEGLKKRLGKPDLKFNIVAHSMGGLISRYAAMYGDAELPLRNPKPTWSGARHFDKIFLVGTPNDGSVLSFKAMLTGYSYGGGGLNLPFIQDIDRYDVFTIPAAYQLLPQTGSFVFYGEDLKPIEVDLFDPGTWESYGWAIWQDENFEKRFSPLEQRNAKSFFEAALDRAKRFHEALDASGTRNIPVSMYLIGGDCKDTLGAVMLMRDEKENQWKPIFEANSFTRSNGEKVSADVITPLLYTKGDGVVTKASLSSVAAAENGNKNVLPVGELYHCEGHTRLVTNPEIQDKLLDWLAGTPVK
ncbi:MAG: hypothetical protein WBD22_03500 [Pyrinomonadaceae bacterium]